MGFEETTVLFLAIPLYIYLISIWSRKQYSLKKIFIYSLSFFYFTGVIALTIFPINFMGNSEFLFNLKFFHTYYDIEIYKQLGTWEKPVQQILGNFVLLLPAGFLIPIILPKIKKNIHIILIGFGISFGIEFLQLLQGFFTIPYKIFDIDDIVLNTLGYILGFIIYKIYKKLERK